MFGRVGVIPATGTTARIESWCVVEKKFRKCLQDASEEDLRRGPAHSP